MGSGEDDFGQAWDGVSARDGESVAEVVPERDFELGAGFDETEKGIAAITTDIAAGAGTDLAPGDVAADVVLRSVGVQWTAIPGVLQRKIFIPAINFRASTSI